MHVRIDMVYCSTYVSVDMVQERLNSLLFIKQLAAVRSKMVFAIHDSKLS